MAIRGSIVLKMLEQEKILDLLIAEDTLEAILEE
jgi:hypothetical protein